MSGLLMRAVGDRACIIDLPDLNRVMSVAAQLRDLRLPGVVDIVPAVRTVLVICADRSSVLRLMAEIQSIGVLEVLPTAAGRDISVDVIYDGADLEAVGKLSGLGVDGVIAAHQASTWNAAFGGFAPGFVYLAGGDPRLYVPRLESPRTRVPAGAVALAGEFSAVYPSDSPGGWQLIGHTEQVMWDQFADPPTLILPGDRVRFRAVSEKIALAAVAASAPVKAGVAVEASVAVTATVGTVVSNLSSGSEAPAALIVERVGIQTLLQDGGRPGYAALGVTDSGALDRGALQRANAAVGNSREAAGLENLHGGLVIRAVQDLVVAVTGAEVSLTTTSSVSAAGSFPIVDSVPNSDSSDTRTRTRRNRGEPFTLHADERLTIGTPERGMRAYVAVRGGLTGTAVLGSVAYDSLSRMGTPPLQDGDALVLADDSQVDADVSHDAERDDPHPAGFTSAAPHPAAATSTAPTPTAPTPTSPLSGHATLRVVLGPRDGWFTSQAQASFALQSWQVTAQSNRIGIRLDGVSLARSHEGELPSEGVVRGSIQVPPSGLPLLFLADHPVTGGYPVIATVVDADLDRAAQLRPGDKLSFVVVDPDSIGDPRAEVDAEPVQLPVRFSIEINGRRHSVTATRAVAEALEQLAACGPADILEQVLTALAAAAEMNAPSG